MRCPQCDADNPPEAVRCRKCGTRLGRRPRRRDPDEEEDKEPSSGDEVVSTIIPYKNVQALVGYYLAIFGMLIPGMGIAALILGIIGLRNVRRDPRAHGTVHAWVGIILGGLDTLCWGGIIAGIILGLILG